MMYQRPHDPSPNPVSKVRGFARLPGYFDPAPLLEELAAVAPWERREAPWLPSQWKWHLRTWFLVLRGGKKTKVPGGELTSGAGVDAPILKKLPRIAEALSDLLPAPAAVAWIGMSPPSAHIYTHVDNTRHWDEHHRIHLPLATNSDARLCVRGRFTHFPAGTLWAINNSAPHGAINGGRYDRLHLMVDLPSTPAVESWLAEGEVRSGVEDPAALVALSQDPFVALNPAERADRALMARLGRQ